MKLEPMVLMKWDSEGLHVPQLLCKLALKQHFEQKTSCFIHALRLHSPPSSQYLHVL